MGKIREIKSSIVREKAFGELSIRARYLFILLWTEADDEGILIGNPKLLSSVLYPFDDEIPPQIGSWLDELEEKGLILRYFAKSEDYIQINNWLKYQYIPRPKRSTHPHPEDASQSGEKGLKKK